MIAGIICYISIGCIIGVIFSLLFVNFDKMWIKILSSLVGFGGSSCIVVGCSNYFEIIDQNMKFKTTSCLCISFIVTFFLMMVLMCKLIKDKDDKDILRIRDILLGKKSYIDKYYAKREKEIDSKLNIEKLQEREKKIEERENSINLKENYINEEVRKIEEIGKKKLRMSLPENTQIIITKSFLNMLPSFSRDLSKCICDIDRMTEEYIKDIDDFNCIDELQIRAYLTSMILSISNCIFGGNSQEARIHFRIYNDESEKYEKFIAIIGNKIVNKKMTPIPFENSMIEKSFSCKRALIQSINSEYNYSSDNNTIWKDYITFSVYGVKHGNLPIFSFGISVKNEERFRDLFYFLNFFRLEQCLEENIEKLNEYINIENVLYKKEGK